MVRCLPHVAYYNQERQGIQAFISRKAPSGTHDGGFPAPWASGALPPSTDNHQQVIDTDNAGNSVLDEVNFSKLGPDSAYRRLPDAKGDFSEGAATPGAANE